MWSYLNSLKTLPQIWALLRFPLWWELKEKKKKHLHWSSSKRLGKLSNPHQRSMKINVCRSNWTLPKVKSETVEARVNRYRGISWLGSNQMMGLLRASRAATCSSFNPAFFKNHLVTCLAKSRSFPQTTNTWMFPQRFLENWKSLQESTVSDKHFVGSAAAALHAAAELLNSF